MAKADKMWFMNGTYKTKEEFIFFLLTLRALGKSNREIAEEIHYSTSRVTQLIGKQPKEITARVRILANQKRRMSRAFAVTKGKKVISQKVARNKMEVAMNEFYATCQRLSTALEEFDAKKSVSSMKAIRKAAESLAGNIMTVQGARRTLKQAS